MMGLGFCMFGLEVLFLGRGFLRRGEGRFGGAACEVLISWSVPSLCPGVEVR